jgi:glycosyltransferase involved in cell wall biosynthesis
MRILHLLSSNAFHGAESMTLQLARAQRAAGHDAALALIDNGDVVNDELQQRFQAAGVEVHRLPCRGRFDAGLVRRLRRLRRSGAFDFFHSHKPKATFHAMLATHGRVPMVGTYHNWVSTDRALQFYAWLDKRLARGNAACVGVSALVCEELRRFVPASRVHHIANGIDIDHWSPETATPVAGFGVPDDAPVIGFVGRLSPEKGVALLIDAFARLEPLGGREVHLLLAGDGPDRAALEAQAARLGVGSRVHFAGTVADARAVYRAVRLVALPSLTEGLPMTVLEAMACGRPAVATAVGELPALITPGETGWLLPNRDAAEFAGLLAGALRDEERLRRVGANARHLVAASYSAATMSAAYARLYTGIMGRRP